jgi:7,8-dihydroneopterin aldolase/epimerase/oxygenase
MFTIHLDNLFFFAYHGVHEEERVLGGDYIVNATVSVNAPEQIVALEEATDYVKIYTVIKQRMQQPTALLETVARDLVYEIYETDKRIKTVEVSVKKSAPPINNFQGSISASYKKEF